MSTENFEERLRNQPLREIPAEWREEILTAAQAAAPSCRLSPVARPAPWWREWLCPSPTAWAGLACVWLMIFALNFAARPTAKEREMASRMPSRSPQEIMTIFAQQQQEVALLLSQSSEMAIEPRRTVPPGPRSECNLATMET